MARRGATRNLVARDDVASKLVVDAILHDELHLVLRTQPFEILPVVLPIFAAARALHVEDGHDAIRNALDAAMATRFEQDGLAIVEKALHERIDILLQQRLAAGHLNQRTPVSIDFADDIVQRALAAFVEGIWRIAPAAPQIARGQADEHTRPSGVCGLALHRVEDLVDGEHVLRSLGFGLSALGCAEPATRDERPETAIVLT